MSPLGAPAEDFKHPPAFWVLFLTEMWERYSYYANRSLLVLFLVSKHEGFSLGDSEATAIYGLFTAATYLAGLPGGWIGDRIAGAQRAVIIGGCGILLGNVLLVAASTSSAFYLGLMVIVAGVGLLKPNVSTLVATIYRNRPDRLDSAFTLYYMGICIGAALAAVVAPLAAVRWGWRFGYAASAAGMAFGLLQFVARRKALPASGLAPADRAGPALQRRALAAVATAGMLAVAVVLFRLLDPVSTARVSAAMIASAAIVYFGWAIFSGARDGVERDRMIVIAVLCAVCALFWAGADLAGSALNLFAERYTNRGIEIAGVHWDVPAAVYQSINPALIIALSPALSLLWLMLARRSSNPSAAAKFAAGLLFCALGLAVMGFASAAVIDGARVGSSWLVSTYVLHTLGELCISPLGLAAINRIAPVRLAGQMMGIWFLSVALGTITASQIAGFMSATDIRASANGYWVLALVMTLMAMLLWLANAKLVRLSHPEAAIG